MKVVGGEPRTSPTLVRVSGLVTMLGGVLWVLWSADFVDFLDPALWILPPLFAAGVVGLYAGHARHSGRLRKSGIVIALAAGGLSVAGLVGGAALDAVNATLAYAGWLVFLLGSLVLFADLVLFGVAAIRTNAPPRWRIVPLVVGIMPVIFFGVIMLYKALSGWWVTDEGLIRFGEVGAAVVIGGGWSVLGYMIWSDKGSSPQRTRPVR